MCVKPADRTTHSPSKICSRPRTATRTTRAFSHSLPAHFRSPSPRRRTPADLTTHSPPKTCSRPRTATRPSRALPLPHAAPTHTRRPHNTFPAEELLPPPHSDAPCPSTFSLPPRPDAHPQAARCIPRRPHNPFPVEDLLPPPHNDTPFPCPPATSPQPRRTPADLTTHSLPKTFARHRTATRPSPALLPHPRSADARPQAARCIPLRPHHPFPAAPPCLPLRSASGTKKNGTAQCMCDAECLGRPSLRSVIGVGEPRAVRRRYGALAWRVGLRPQPWALRSRRCGRVLRA